MSRAKLGRIKNPFKLGAVTDDYVKGDFWNAWVELVRLFKLKAITDEFDVVDQDGAPRTDSPEINELKRLLIDQKRNGKSFDELLLVGWATNLLRDGKNPTSRLLAENMQISPDTFYRRFSRKQVKEIRQAVLRTFRRNKGVPTSEAELVAEYYRERSRNAGLDEVFVPDRSELPEE